MIELFENNDAVETEEAQRINKIWEGLRDEPGYSPDGLTNPLYRRQPNPPERRRDLMRPVISCQPSVEN